MKKENKNKPEIKLIGLSIRTNNSNERNPETAKIAGVAGHYWSQSIADKMIHRKNPGVTLAVYTEYDSNEHGDYTYFIGEEVDSFEDMPTTLQKLTIPAANYQKFTTSPGKFPDIVINAWQEIWKMTPDDFGGQRIYQADFEVYDKHAMDPNQAIVDIYIGIK